MASTVTLVTGHEDPTKGPTTLEWPRLASTNGTLVFLMGMKNLPSIVEHLKTEGKPANTPVALIRWGTRASQRTLVGTLGDIVAKSEQAEMEPPTVIVVGEVVRLREQLNWFETRPLFGKRILVTRTREQAPELSSLLSAYGADPVECPTIEVVPPETWRELDEAVADLRRYQWVIFTSVNGVRPFMERLRHQGRDVRALSGLRLCCIGPRTAEELTRHGLSADLVPSEFQAEGVIEALKHVGVAGQRILIPRAAVAREILPEQLRTLGADVQVVTAYRTVLPSGDSSDLKDRLRRRDVHVITFTSSSTVRNFRRLFDSGEEMKKLTEGTVVACIGPITAKTAREQGLPVTMTATQNTVPALVEAIVQYFSTGTPGRRRNERAQER
jgi:uroporphyrinogen III methyltransferase/synthase